MEAADQDESRAESILARIEELIYFTRNAEGPGLLSSYERAEHTRILEDAASACDERDYRLCADLLSKLDGPEVRALAECAEKLEEARNEAAYERQVERYYGDSGPTTLDEQIAAVARLK